MLTDIVSLVRYTLHQDDELVPFRDQVEQRFAAWLSAQEQRGVTFTVEQLQWLTWMKENIAGELGIARRVVRIHPVRGARRHWQGGASLR